MTSIFQLVVLGAIPPLCRPRPADRMLGIDRWLVLAFPTKDSYARARYRGEPIAGFDIGGPL